MACVDRTSGSRARFLVLVATAPSLFIMCIALAAVGLFAGLPSPLIVVAVAAVIGWFRYRISRVSMAREHQEDGRIVVRNLYRTHSFGQLAEGKNVKYRGLRIIGPASALFVRTETGRWVAVLRLISVSLEDL